MPGMGGTKENPSSGSAPSDVGIDKALRAARAQGLSDPVEVGLPTDQGTTYVVKQVQRSWPEKQDAIAVDPATGKGSRVPHLRQPEGPRRARAVHHRQIAPQRYDDERLVAVLLEEFLQGLPDEAPVPGLGPLMLKGEGQRGVHDGDTHGVHLQPLSTDPGLKPHV